MAATITRSPSTISSRHILRSTKSRLSVRSATADARVLLLLLVILSLSLSSRACLGKPFPFSEPYLIVKLNKRPSSCCCRGPRLRSDVLLHGATIARKKSADSDAAHFPTVAKTPRICPDKLRTKRSGNDGCSEHLVLACIYNHRASTATRCVPTARFSTVCCVACGAKNAFSPPFSIKIIVLPRQARDKHRKR